MERAVIVEGARTPIGKFLGSFAETPAVELGRIAAVEAMRRANVEADQVDQTIMGHARQAGNGPNTGRQVSIRAGVPEEVSAFNVNIACGSGMKATQLGAQQIMLGEADVVLVGESLVTGNNPRRAVADLVAAGAHPALKHRD